MKHLWSVGAFMIAVAGQSVAAGASTGWYLLEPILIEKPVTEQQMAREFVYWQTFDKPTQRDLMAEASLDRNAPMGRWKHAFLLAERHERSGSWR
jgi:hypothetical protein